MSKIFNNSNHKKHNYYRRVKRNTTKRNKKSKKNHTIKHRACNNLSNNWKKILSETYNWQKVAMSNNGKHQTIIVRSKLAPTADPLGSGNIFLSHDYGKTWDTIKKNDSFNLNWEGLSMSGTGKYQTAVVEGSNIYTSTDYGVNWKMNKASSNWITVCMSNSGKHQTVVSNGFFHTEPGTGFIYTSTDYGNTWQPKTKLNVSWVWAAMSSDGKIQTACSFLPEGELHKHYKNSKDVGYVYNSYDYGETWERNKTLSQTWWVSVAMSGNGKIQTACAINCNLDYVPPGPIYISHDYGKAFNRVICPSEPWLTLSISKNGKYLIAASYKQKDENDKDIPNTGGMILSENYGKTWKYTNAPRSQYTTVAITEDGCHATATAWDDGIYQC